MLKLSEKVYRKLLCLYPKSFREEFGEPMMQLFRDQLRATKASSGPVGMISFWSRIILDLVCSCCREHFRRRFPQSARRTGNNDLTATRFFLIVFVGLMTAFAARITMLPKYYSGKVLISAEGSLVLDSSNSEGIAGMLLSEMLKSRSVSLKTEPIYTLNIFSTNQLDPTEPNKTITEITVKARDEALAVLIANGIADTFCRNSYELAVPSRAQQEMAQPLTGKRRAIRGKASMCYPGKNFQILERATIEKVQPVSRDIPLKIMNGIATSFGIAFILAFYMWCVQSGRASLSNALHHPTAEPL